MENDWQKLGDVVARIVARTEGVMRDRPQIPTDEAALFVLMLREIYAPAAPRAAALSQQVAKPAEGAE